MQVDDVRYKWLSPPERSLGERAVDRYARGQLPAYDKAVERGGLESLPYLVCAQASILIAGVLMICGFVIRFVATSGSTANTVSNVLLGLFGLFFILGVIRIAQGVAVRNHRRRSG
jgi:hypothetical protein